MLWLLRGVGGALGICAYSVGVRSKVTIDNLANAFPEWSSIERRRTARRCYALLGMVFFEFLYLRFASKKNIEQGLEIINLQEYLPILESNKGAILLSGHLGNWEWLALGCGLRVKRPLDVIIKNQTGPLAERFLIRMRSRFGNKMMDAGNTRAIYRAARSGELLAILGDQTGSPEDVRVPLFGRSVPVFEGTARIALAAQIPILFLEPFERTAFGYRCQFHLVPSADLKEQNPETVRELTRRHTALLESIIRKKPEFWLWQHKRWKHAKELE